MTTVIDLSVRTIEALAVATIVWTVLHATVRYLVNLRAARQDAYERFRVYIGKGLLLGLELLVAADILETVLVDPTLDSMKLLALLVVVRTFLSWSISVEIEGRWPWQRDLGVARDR
jgi:uncharacterized membrane protein